MNARLILLLLPVLASCAVSRNYNPNHKFSPTELQADYRLMRNILEEKHPALYWYTPKEEMDEVFDRGWAAIADSMTELQFGWQVLAPVLSAIHCGHTSFAMSRNWNRFIEDRAIPSFPLYLKIWSDTMMVLGNLHRNDTTFRRGTFIDAINGIRAQELIETMFSYMSADGYSNQLNYMRLSASFPYFHRNIYGLYPDYFVNYSDTAGNPGVKLVSFFEPEKPKKSKESKRARLTTEERLQRVRSVQYFDSTAVMTINRFMQGRLNRFYRQAFRELKKRGIQHLIIDLRANGGGDMNKSVLLTRYIKDSTFRVSDTTYAISQTFSPYTRYISKAFWNNIGLLLVTKKKQDGNYHFGYWENHTFKPKKKHHFDGNVFVLTGGYTFSASSLFANAVKGQENVTLVGEETGGGWYGNSGILIPNVTLPNTRLRIRLPFFKLVQYNHVDVKGTGVLPDVEVPVQWRDVIKRRDTTMEKAKALISGKE